MQSPSYFEDQAVPLSLLKQRAFNLRWAEQASDIIPLTAADPDFAIAQPIRDAIAKYAYDGVMSYAPAQGLPVFRATVARWLTEDKSYACNADEIIATDSAAAGMEAVAASLLQRGDEAIIFDPVDFLFATVTERAGAIAVRVPLQVDSSDDEIMAKLDCARSRHTRVLWLCNPHNPLGKVFSHALLLRIGDWAITHKITVVSDEIWSDIVYAPEKHVAIASLFPNDKVYFISIYGFSKNFALAGLRIGCVVCHSARVRQRILDLSGASATIAGANVLSQVAVQAALSHCQDWLSEFVQHLNCQRDYVCHWLNQLPGVQVNIPQGTYVAFPNISGLNISAEALTTQLATVARVAVVPGASKWFGPGANGHIRLCFATSKAILKEAMQRMEPVFHSVAKSAHQPLVAARS